MASQIGGYENPDPNNPGFVIQRSVKYVKNKYNFADNYWTDSPSSPRKSRSDLGRIGRLELISKYLDQDTYNHFLNYSSGQNSDFIMSQAMNKTGQYLILPNWGESDNGYSVSYPKVNLYRRISRQYSTVICQLIIIEILIGRGSRCSCHNWYNYVSSNA